MFILKKFAVEGVSPFKKRQEFVFKPGITVVYGLNRVTSASRNGNGSGKSRLLKTIPGVLFQNPLTGTAQDRVKTGVRTIELSKDGQDYTFVKTGTKLKIYDAQNKLIGRSVRETREWLEKNFDLNEEKFAATTYIDALRHHPLVKGTTAERKLFLNQFFELDKIDSERKLINAAINKLSHVQATYVSLEERAEQLEKLLANSQSIAELKHAFESSSSKLQKLQDRASRAMETRRLIEFVQDNRKLIAQLDEALAGDELTVQRFASLLQNCKEDLRENTSRMEQAQAWHEYKLKNTAYEDAIDALPKHARRALKSGKESTAKAHYTKYVEAKSEFDSLNRIEKPQRPERVEEPTSNLIKCVSDLTRLEIQYSHAKQLHTGACPVCGQDVQVQNPEDMKARIRYLRAEVSKWEQYKEYKKAFVNWKAANREYEEKVEKREHFEKRMAAYKEGYDLHKLFRNLPDKPKEWVGKKYPLQEYTVMAGQDKERLRVLNLLQPNVQLIIDYRALDNKRYDSEVLAEVQSLADRHAAIGAELELTRDRKSQLKTIRAEMEGLAEDRRVLRDLKLIAQGYSDKALKRMAVNQISSLLMNQVNRFASRIFPEDYRFEMKWDSSQLDILVHRRYGKRMEVSDVRDLSGAESRQLTYIMVLALLTFIPEKQRCNVLVLDEPTANMSEETIESFKTLLAVMNTVIPCIVVVTPDADEVYDGAQCYTVVKVNGRSTLVPGHPKSIK